MSRRSLTWLPFAVIVIAFCYLHSKIYFNSDVTYLLIVAQRMLEGGQYVQDFFESNPPMIVYLYMPAICLAKFFPSKLFFIFDSYVFGLITLSVWSTSLLLKRSIADKATYLGMHYTLLSILLLLCYQEYGQREHLFLILTMPYFFAAALRYQQQNINVTFAVFIGVMAGLGFAIKPLFLAPLCLVELAFIIQQRRWLAWARVESLVVLTILCLYLACIFIFANTYIQTILPIVSKYYFTGIAMPWKLVLLDPLLIYSLCCCAAYFIFASHDRYPALGKMLLLAQLGMIISCLATKSICFYRFLPAFSLSMLLLVFCLLQLASTKQLWRSKLALLSIFLADALYTLAYAFLVKTNPETSIFFYKFFTVMQIFFMLTLSCFFYWFLFQKKQAAQVIPASLIVLLIFAVYQWRSDVGFIAGHSHLVFSFMLFMDSWIILNIMACLWMALSHFSIKSLNNTLTAQRIVVWPAVVFIIYFSPLNIIYENRLNQLDFQRAGDQLTHFLKNAGSAKVDCFSSMACGCFPMISYSGQQFSGRASNFWWLPGLSKTPDSIQTRKDADFLVNIITADLTHQKPQMIVLDTNMFYEQYDGIFVKNKNFQQEWQHYRLVKGIPNLSPDAHFYVYKRIS